MMTIFINYGIKSEISYCLQIKIIFKYVCGYLKMYNLNDRMYIQCLYHTP